MSEMICPNCGSIKIMKRQKRRACLNCGLIFEIVTFIGEVA